MAWSLFGNRLFIFGSFGKLFCQVALPVTMHLWFSFVLTKLSGNIVVIDNVVQNRQDRLQEDHQRYGYYCFFHGAKVVGR